MIKFKRTVVQEAVVRSGDRFRPKGARGKDDIEYTILFTDGKAVVVWTGGYSGRMSCVIYDLSTVEEYFTDGSWILVEGDAK